MNIIKYKELYKECKELDNELNKKRNEIQDLINETCNDILWKFKTYNSWRSNLFKSDEYKDAVNLFGD